MHADSLTVHGDLVRLQFQNLLLEELLLNVALEVVLSFGEPLETHLNTCKRRQLIPCYGKHTRIEVSNTHTWWGQKILNSSNV